MIIIAQYHGVSKLSRLIQWQQRSPISHSAIILGDGARVACAAGRMPEWLQSCTLYEAWGTVVPPKGRVYRRKGISKGHTPGTRIDLYAVDCPIGQYDEVRLFLDSEVGSRYDFRALFSFITRRDRHRDGAWICSELAFAAALLYGVRLLDRIEPHAVSPGLLDLSPMLIPFGTTWSAPVPVFIPAISSQSMRGDSARPTRTSP